jgi:hypothetical protein
MTRPECRVFFRPFFGCAAVFFWDDIAPHLYERRHLRSMPSIFSTLTESHTYCMTQHEFGFLQAKYGYRYANEIDRGDNSSFSHEISKLLTR